MSKLVAERGKFSKFHWRNFINSTAVRQGEIYGVGKGGFQTTCVIGVFRILPRKIAGRLSLFAVFFRTLTRFSTFIAALWRDCI